MKKYYLFLIFIVFLCNYLWCIKLDNYIENKMLLLYTNNFKEIIMKETIDKELLEEYFYKFNVDVIAINDVYTISISKYNFKKEYYFLKEIGYESR